jgi:acyl carrier protein
VQPDTIIPDASWVDDLDADSLDTVELIMCFEEVFKIDIPEVDAERIRTVQDAVDYISAKTSTLIELLAAGPAAKAPIALGGVLGSLGYGL